MRGRTGCGNLGARREAVIAENARKASNMKTEMTESLEELNTYYEQFNEKVVTQRHEVEGLDRRINDLRLEVAVRPARGRPHVILRILIMPATSSKQILNPR